MATLNVRTACAVFLACFLIAGCAATPTPSYKAAQERTPSWLKHRVTGSRIARPANAPGESASADYVKSTTPQGLLILPGVTFQKIH